MSTPIEDQRVVGPTSAAALDGMAHTFLLAFLATREHIGAPLSPMAWLVLGDAEDGRPVALRVAPPTQAAVDAVGDRLTYITVSEGDYLRAGARRDLATVQSYITANGGEVDGYPGLETRIIAIVHGPGARMWSSPQPPEGEPWARPALGDAETFVIMGDGTPTSTVEA